MTTIAQDEAQRSIADCIAETANGPVLLENDGRTVAALISMQDFEIVRRAKAERLVQVMRELGEEYRAAAAEEGISLDELEKMLDRHTL